MRRRISHCPEVAQLARNRRNVGVKRRTLIKIDFRNFSHVVMVAVVKISIRSNNHVFCRSDVWRAGKFVSSISIEGGSATQQRRERFLEETLPSDEEVQKGGNCD